MKSQPLKGSVADWLIEKESEAYPTMEELAAGKALPAEVYQDMDLLITTLYETQLMVPQTMRIKFHPEAPSPKNRKEIDLDQDWLIPELPMDEIADFLLDKIAEFGRKNDVYCLEILEIKGKGKVKTADSTYPSPDILHLENFRFFERSWALRTYSDIWMPLSLDGEWQIDQFNYNFHRIENAFKELSKSQNWDIFPSPETLTTTDSGNLQKGFRIFSNPLDLQNKIEKYGKPNGFSLDKYTKMVQE